jgi:pilus assembly protein CpaC
MAVAITPVWFCRNVSALFPALLALSVGWLLPSHSLHAQQRLTNQWSLSNSALSIEPNSERQLLEMVVNTSREIIADQPFRRVRIQNPDLIKAIPLEGGNRLQISALRTGVTQVDLLGADESVATVEVVVMGDVRELETILRRTFPQATLELTPISQGIIVNGFVSSSADVDTLTLIAQQYFPTVINRVTVTGIHTVQLHTQIMEVSRTKLRTLGIDWELIDGNDFVESTVGRVLNNATFRWSVVDNDTSFTMSIEALRRNNLVKVLASPTLTAVDGRPASFNVGGEIPILVPAGLGQIGIQYREFGTRLDYVAKVLGNGRIYLEVRPYVSEIDPSRSVTLQGVSVPGLRSRFLETGVELNAGQTLALGGLLQLRTETINSGLPGLSEMPYLGIFFRKVREEQNEIELLITVTPDYAGAMDPHQVPYVVPGISTESPNDNELYFKGYTEVPSQSAQHCLQSNGLFETVPAGQQVHPVSNQNSTLSTQPRPATLSVGPHAPLLVDSPELVPASGRSDTATGPRISNYR